MKRLSWEIFGEENGNLNPVVICHGLFGSRKNWRTIGRSLSRLGVQVIAVDMRNHGKSFWDKEHSYIDLSEDLKNVIDQFGGVADLIGHSMGGKAAMTLSLQYPKSVGKLVVIDIAPINYAHDQSVNIKAMQQLELRDIKSRAEAASELSKYVRDASLCAFFLQSLEFQDGINGRWLINLASLERNLAKIMRFPEINGSSFVNSLFIRGALSDYINEADFSAIKRYFPNSQIITVDDAGHWVHVEKQKLLLNYLTNFLLGAS